MRTIRTVVMVCVTTAVLFTALSCYRQVNFRVPVLMQEVSITATIQNGQILEWKADQGTPKDKNFYVYFLADESPCVGVSNSAQKNNFAGTGSRPAQCVAAGIPTKIGSIGYSYALSPTFVAAVGPIGPRTPPATNCKGCIVEGGSNSRTAERQIADDAVHHRFGQIPDATPAMLCKAAQIEVDRSVGDVTPWEPVQVTHNVIWDTHGTGAAGWAITFLPVSTGQVPLCVDGLGNPATINSNNPECDFDPHAAGTYAYTVAAPGCGNNHVSGPFHVQVLVP